jgi:PLP dependent protein
LNGAPSRGSHLKEKKRAFNGNFGLKSEGSLILVSNLPGNVQMVRERIATACRRSGRNPDAVTVVAVGKTRTLDEIRAVLASGLTDLGENRVQELVAKREAIGEVVTWHLIGTLQTNKVKHAIQNADLIHTLDRDSLLDELSRQAERLGRTVRVLVQVNVSGEQTKHGLEAAALPDFLRRASRSGNVRITGLMTMAPLAANPEEVRPVFRRLRQLADEAQQMGLPNVEMHWLSMGMSNDYEVAVEEGANLVRIGTALFGNRPQESQSGGDRADG